MQQERRPELDPYGERTTPEPLCDLIGSLGWLTRMSSTQYAVIEQNETPDLVVDESSSVAMRAGESGAVELVQGNALLDDDAGTLIGSLAVEVRRILSHCRTCTA